MKFVFPVVRLRRGSLVRSALRRWRKGWGTHSLAPLSLRGATYSGVFTLLPLITGENRSHHGKILTEAASLAEAGKLKPLLTKERLSTANIEAAHALVESGSLGKVVVEIG